MLVFDPAKAFPYGAQGRRPGRRDRAVEGEGAARARRSRARSGSRPSRASSVTAADRPSRPRGHRQAAVRRAGRSAAAAGPPSRRYYLRLMNCTRTGGWVTSGGNCTSPGGRNVAPLKLDAGISSRSRGRTRSSWRPAASATTSSAATRAIASAAPATPSYRWAENLGCRVGQPVSAVLGSHLYFQSERPGRPTAATT